MLSVALEMLQQLGALHAGRKRHRLAYDLFPLQGLLRARAIHLERVLHGFDQLLTYFFQRLAARAGARHFFDETDVALRHFFVDGGELHEASWDSLRLPSRASSISSSRTEGSTLCVRKVT